MRVPQSERNRATGDGDIAIEWGPHGLSVSDQRVKPFWAAITSQDGSTNRYGWEQVDETDTTFPQQSTGTQAYRGTATTGDLPAYEINGRTDLATDGSVKVQMWPGGNGDWLVFQATGATGSAGTGSTINVEERDGSPSYTGITKLQFDQDDGFVLSEPSSGVARVKLTPALTHGEALQTADYDMSSHGPGPTSWDYVHSSGSTDLTVTIADVGTYEVWYELNVLMVDNEFSETDLWVEARLYNVTAVAAVAGTTRYVTGIALNSTTDVTTGDQTIRGSASSRAFVTVSVANTIIGLQTLHNNGGTGQPDTVEVHDAVIRYVRIG